MANESILLIDDEVASRRPCSIYLKAYGYKVQEAEDGEEGIELFNKGDYDLVLTDLMMPGINGIEVLRQVKEKNKNCGVIIMTAYAGVETGVESMKLGAYDYIVKPLKLDELNVKIGRCLEDLNLLKKIKELDEMLALYEISKAMFSTTQLQELLELIVDSTLKVLTADQVSLMLFDDNGKLYIPISRGLDKEVQEKTKIELGERIAGKVAEYKHPVIINAGDSNSPFEGITFDKGKVKSAMICPLMAKDKLLGVINISRINIDRNFTEKDLHKAVIFTSQITSAIENANLFKNLQQEKEKIEFMFKGMGDGAVITDAHVNILMINRSAELLLGLNKNDCVGKNFFNLIEDFEVTPLEEVEEEEKKIITLELVRKMGKPLYLSVLATKLRSESGIGGQILIIRDVTEERREAQVVRNFISAMSHKLKTPLTGIISAAELMKADKENMNDIGIKAAQIIEDQSWELSNLVNSLLSFSTFETQTFELSFKEKSLAEILKRCVDNLNQKITSANAEVKIAESINNLPEVMVDNKKIHEVFENLIENGIKFNDKKDKIITIEAFSQKNDFVRIEISDNGIGIPSEEYNKIFNKFYQIEVYFTGQVKGAGLGLALAKKLIEEHKGSIWVESEMDKGSKFILLLPKAMS
jgi:PAS domain S-box-containing protein